MSPSLGLGKRFLSTKTWKSLTKQKFQDILSVFFSKLHSGKSQKNPMPAKRFFLPKIEWGIELENRKRSHSSRKNSMGNPFIFPLHAQAKNIVQFCLVWKLNHRIPAFQASSPGSKARVNY